MKNLLTLNNVSYQYGTGENKQLILENLTYQFNEKTFYTIVGPSVSGKTTLLSIASGLEKNQTGEILFSKADVNKQIKLQNYRKKYCSIIFQAYNLIPYMTALQNVCTAIEVQGTHTKKIKEEALKVLLSVGLTKEQVNKPILKLSGGQQQRVAIARALSSKAPLIFADEPTGNLDGATSASIIQLFKELAHDKGKCVIMVTHDETIANQSDIKLKLHERKLQEIK